MYVRSWKEGLNGTDSRLDLFKDMVYENKKSLAIFRGYLSFNSYTKSNEMTLNTRLDGEIFEIFTV